ncbi:MAG: hypothetical protein FJ293_06945 [Planctomycetes bacterium]|nr:hypothetical protein [Planctomycetota bacterium]
MAHSTWASRCGVAWAAFSWCEKPLQVRVVDPATARRGEHLNRWLLVARTTAPDGTATFDVQPLEVLLEEYEFQGAVARLVVPTLDPVQARVDLRFPESEPLVLTCPPVGAVQLDLAGMTQGEVRLRALAAHRSRTPRRSACRNRCRQDRTTSAT